MIAILEPLPRGTVAALERAVRHAAAWRGYYIGDSEALAQFDAEMKAARAALAAVRKQDRAMRQAVKATAAALAGTGAPALH